MAEDALPLQESNVGFEWGPIKVTRLFEDRGAAFIAVESCAGLTLEIYVSPAGRVMKTWWRGSRVGEHLESPP